MKMEPDKFRSIRKQRVYDLLKGIETGDPESVKVVNEDKYIQHNPQTHEGGEGLAQLFARLSKTNPKVEIVRLFEDEDFVFGHTIYDFSSVRIGFEVFRYEGDQVVEHWDNIQPRVDIMVGGSTQVCDRDQTEANRRHVKAFIEEVFMGANANGFGAFVNEESLVDHSPLCQLSEKVKLMDYQKNHRLLAEGNFVLAVNEGFNGEVHTSFYDLYRLDGGKIVEHWDTTEAVPPKEKWNNDNGKF
jgi:predicted SnoaL-like aldol condensation-catalyzing enzyme